MLARAFASSRTGAADTASPSQAISPDPSVLALRRAPCVGGNRRYLRSEPASTRPPLPSPRFDGFAAMEVGIGRGYLGPEMGAVRSMQAARRRQTVCSPDGSELGILVCDVADVIF